MTTIWKYPVEVSGRPFRLEMPELGYFLGVQLQHGEPVMWFEVDPDEPRVARTFVVVGTGHPVPADAAEYLGTFQLHDGYLVLHLYECDEEAADAR